VETVLIPIKLDIEALLKKFPHQIRNFKKDKLLIILNLISEIPILKKDLLSPKGFVRLHSKLMQSIVHNYKEYLEYLVECQVIEIDKQYIVGQRPRGYRFTKKYASEVKELKLQSEELNLTKVTKNLTIKDLIRRHKRSYLTEWLTNGSLEFDYLKALKHINEDYRVERKEESNKALRRYNSGIISITRLRDKNIYYFVDATSKRLHSNYTNLRTELRDYISFKGEKLISIDLKNSQPYLSILLFNKKFYQAYQLINITKLGLESISEYEIKRIKESVYIILDKLQYRTSILDINKYVKLVSSGKLYEHLQEQLSIKTGQEKVDRKTIKKATLAVFFGEHEFFGGFSSVLKKIFKNDFPIIYEVFGSIKKKKKNRLAIILQRIESYIFLDVVCKKISKESPEIPLITIHDSIATISEHVDEVERTMINTFVSGKLQCTKNGK